MKKLGALMITLLGAAPAAMAQCAMCRTTLENNVSNGNIGIAAGINTGILYLFFAPYLAVAVIAYFWYRNSRTHGNEELPKGTVLR